MRGRGGSRDFHLKEGVISEASAIQDSEGTREGGGARTDEDQVQSMRGAVVRVESGRGIECLKRRLRMSRPEEARKSSKERPAALRGSGPQRGLWELESRRTTTWGVRREAAERMPAREERPRREEG